MPEKEGTMELAAVLCPNKPPLPPCLDCVDAAIRVLGRAEQVRDFLVRRH